MENKNQPTRRHIYRALEAKSLRSRSFATRVADYLTNIAGKPAFLFINVVLFAVWIGVNSNFIAAIPTFDPFPFGLLTMIMSIEAIILSIFVLISQNRASQTATLRDELQLRLNLIAEQEITKSLQILYRIEKKLEIKSKDAELEEMIKNLDRSNLENSIMTQIKSADQPLVKFNKDDFSGLIQSLTNFKP